MKTNAAKLTQWWRQMLQDSHCDEEKCYRTDTVMETNVGLTRWCKRNVEIPTEHSVSMAIFPGEPGLADCPLNSPSPFIPGLHVLLNPIHMIMWNNTSALIFSNYQWHIFINCGLTYVPPVMENISVGLETNFCAPCSQSDDCCCYAGK